MSRWSASAEVALADVAMVVTPASFGMIGQLEEGSLGPPRFTSSGCAESLSDPARSLERHCIRGLRLVTLHAAMSVLAFQATAPVRVLAGERERMRWMVRKVA